MSNNEVALNQYTEGAEGIKRLNKDLAQAAKMMTPQEARFLVRYYYIVQDDRIAFNGQMRAMTESEEPNLVLSWMADQSTVLESQIKRALDKFTDEHPVGQWLKSLYGIGPVLAAGLIGHIDIRKAPTAGHIWSFAGLLHDSKWDKGEKRPWNAELKKLCWKIGESFVMFSKREECYYGQLFRERKKLEWERNLTGKNAEQARQDSKTYGPTTEAYAWVNGCFKAEDIRRYVEAEKSMTQDDLKKMRGPVGSGTPMLPPSQMHGRARRWAVKIFISHLQQMWYETEFKCRAPRPFLIEHGGHAHEIQIPNYTSPYIGNSPSMPFKVMKG